MGKDLNFSWVIEGKLAGCGKPYLDEDLTFLYEKGIRALVRLEKGGFMSEDIKNAGIADFQESIPDLTAPSQDQINRIIKFIRYHLNNSRPVAVSCVAGIGKTGTILTCYFVSECCSINEAETIMRKKGRKPYETSGQKKAIEEFANRKNVM